MALYCVNITFVGMILSNVNACKQNMDKNYHVYMSTSKECNLSAFNSTQGLQFLGK